MSYDIVREKIVLDQNIGKETTQILLEGDIIVPDIKSDMSIILQADAQINIDRTEISTDRINYMGRLNIQVLYLGKGNEKPVHSMSITAPVDDFINMEGITKDMWVEVKADIQNIDYNMINDRKISYRAVVDIRVSANTSDIHEVVVNIDGLPQTQQQKLNLSLSKNVANRLDRFIIKDEITVPSGKPNIREILQTNIEVSNQDVRVGNEKVSITGDLIITTLYKGDTDQSILEFMEHEVPFNGTIEVLEAREDMFSDIVLNMQDKYIQVKPDDDGEDRIIELEISMGTSVRVSTQENIEILEDAYCINKELEMEKSFIKYPRLVCRNKNQSSVKEVVQLDNACPNILQIFRVKGKAHLDDIKIIADKVVTEGFIETDILYIAKSDDTPLYSYKTMIPYRQVIETKGALPEMDVSVDISVDHISFNMLSDNEIDLRFTITFNTHVSEQMEACMINDIKFIDMDKEILDIMPSITVYVVQKNDTLWKIAKMYNTSVDEIIALNDIENPDLLYPGEKLLILKKVFMD